MSPKALLLLADGFEDTEAVCTVDVLKRGGFVIDIARVRTAAQLKQDTGHVVSSAYADLKIVPSVDADKDKDALMKAEYSVIILPGGLPGATHLGASSAVIELLKDQQAKKRWIAAICAAPVEVLKKQNLLGAAKAVCYPSMAADLGDSKAQTSKMTHVDEDHKIITSSGPATAMEFGLIIVSTIISKDAAHKVAQGLLYTHPF